MSISLAAPAYGRAPSAVHVHETHWGRFFTFVIVLVWGATHFVGGFQTAILALTLFGLAAAALGLLHAPLGVLGITVLCLTDAPARVYVMTDGLLPWNTMNYLMVLVVLAGLPTLLRFRDVHSRLLVVYALLLGFGVLISPSFGDGVQEVLTVVAAFGFLYYFARAAMSRELWYWVGANGALLTTLMGFAYYQQSAELEYLNPNAWALTLLGGVFATCLAFPATEGRPLRRAYLLGLFSMAMVWIFLSGSRGSLLIGLACSLMLLFSLPGLTLRVLAVSVAAIIGIGAASYFGDLQATATHRLDKLLNRGPAANPELTLSERTSGRSDLVIGGLYIFRHNPLGVGTGGFPYAWERLDPEAGITFARGRQFNAHSGWIKVLAENGVPATSVLLAWVLSFAVIGARNRERHRRLLGLATTCALGLALVSTEFQPKPLWFLAAGTTVLLSRRGGPAGSLLPPALSPPREDDRGV